ncbi:MAG: hypothetical protein WA071_20575 [Undibacterium umbellatum]|uniref:hypothetical protein n=1 Tax=Undibacterium umbellatum TaxID=2762300 RepID=UPI003BB49349
MVGVATWKLRKSAFKQIKHTTLIRFATGNFRVKEIFLKKRVYFTNLIAMLLEYRLGNHITYIRVNTHIDSNIASDSLTTIVWLQFEITTKLLKIVTVEDEQKRLRLCKNAEFFFSIKIDLSKNSLSDLFDIGKGEPIQDFL